MSERKSPLLLLTRQALIQHRLERHPGPVSSSLECLSPLDGQSRGLGLP